MFKKYYSQRLKSAKKKFGMFLGQMKKKLLYEN